MALQKPKLVTLTLKQKAEVIKEKEKGKSYRKLAEQFGVGKTQIGDIFKRKRESRSFFTLVPVHMHCTTVGGANGAPAVVGQAVHTRGQGLGKGGLGRGGVEN